VRVPAFVRLGRPLFLVGGFVLFALGAAIAAWQGYPIDRVRYVLGQLVVTAFQLMTHYANEYFDYDADVANHTPTRWSGGSRVLPAGELPQRVALEAAIVLAWIGAATSIALVVLVGGWTLPTVVAIAVLAWEYSAPPWRLCAAGLGELTTAAVVTVLVPWLGFSIQVRHLAAAPFALAIVPLALLQFAMLVAIELPDADGDRATGKRTLVVRFGERAAARIYATATIAAFAWLPIAAALGLPPRVAAAAALFAPVAVWRALRIREGRYDRIGFFAVFLLIATAVAELAGFAVQ